MSLSRKKIFKENCECCPTFRVSSCPIGPPGPPGPIGPPGPPGGGLAYGSLYGALNLISIKTGERFDFFSTGPFSGVIPNTVDDEIQVGSSGVYTIDVSFSLQAQPVDSSIFSIFINNVEDTRGRMIHQQVDLTIDNIAKIIQIDLIQGDVISVKAVSVQGNVAYFNPSLIVTRIA